MIGAAYTPLTTYVTAYIIGSNFTGHHSAFGNVLTVDPEVACLIPAGPILS